MISTEGENARRERDTRVLPLETMRQSSRLSARQAQTGNAGNDTGGYYDDATGTYVYYFALDASLLDGPDVTA